MDAPKKLGDMSEIELKAVGYDLIKRIELAQLTLKTVIQELENRFNSKPAEPEKPADNP